MVNDKAAVQLGDLAKDMVTGFEGIVTARTTWLHGCDRISITPNKLTDNKPGKEEIFDEQRVEIVEKAKVPAVFPSAESLIALPIGAEAKDSITGFTGIISGMAVFIGGDIHVMIEPTKLDKDLKPREMEAFHSTRIDVIKPKPIPKTKAKVTGKDGGPAPRGEGTRLRR